MIDTWEKLSRVSTGLMESLMARWEDYVNSVLTSEDLGEIVKMREDRGLQYGFYSEGLELTGEYRWLPLVSKIIEMGWIELEPKETKCIALTGGFVVGVMLRALGYDVEYKSGVHVEDDLMKRVYDKVFPPIKSTKSAIGIVLSGEWADDGLVDSTSLGVSIDEIIAGPFESLTGAAKHHQGFFVNDSVCFQRVGAVDRLLCRLVRDTSVKPVKKTNRRKKRKRKLDDDEGYAFLSEEPSTNAFIFKSTGEKDKTDAQ